MTTTYNTRLLIPGSLTTRPKQHEKLIMTIYFFLSFCDLTAEFAVVVEDTAAPNNVIPTFVILSSSCLGIVFGSIAAFYIDSYCF